MNAHAPVHAAAHDGHDQPHASGATYVRIAIVLFVFTALEVLLYEVSGGDLKTLSFSPAIADHFVSILLVLSAAKFWLVAMFYMHLKFDIKALSWVFGSSLFIAAVVILSLFVLFTYNRTLWWGGAPWH
jgi:cytochrome c oxidase subunit 4